MTSFSSFLNGQWLYDLPKITKYVASLHVALSGKKSTIFYCWFFFQFLRQLGVSRGSRVILQYRVQIRVVAMKILIIGKSVVIQIVTSCDWFPNDLPTKNDHRLVSPIQQIKRRAEHSLLCKNITCFRMVLNTTTLQN